MNRARYKAAHAKRRAAGKFCLRMANILMLLTAGAAAQGVLEGTAPPVTWIGVVGCLAMGAGCALAAEGGGT